MRSNSSGVYGKTTYNAWLPDAFSATRKLPLKIRAGGENLPLQADLLAGATLTLAQ